MFLITTVVGCVKNWTVEMIPLVPSLVVFLLGCITVFPMRISPSSFYAVIIAGLLLNLTRGDKA